MSMPPPRQEPLARHWERLPEAAMLSDDAARRAVLRAVHQRVLHNSVRAILFGGALTLAGIVASRFVRARLGAFVTGLGLPLLTIDALFGVGLIAAMLYGTFGLFNPSVRRALRRELVARGVAVCLRCGYDCRGQREPRCPECGTPFDRKLLTPPGNSP